MRRVFALSLLSWLFLVLPALSKDRLVFQNGDTLSGTFLGRTETLLYFESDILGTLKIPSAAATVILEHPIPPPETTSPENVVATETPESKATPEVEKTSPVSEPEEEELSESAKEEIEKKQVTGLSQLWESTERTLNRFVNDRVPDWFPVLPDNWKGMLKLGYNLNDAEKTSTRYFGEFDLEGDKPITNFYFKTYFAYAEQDRSKSENDWGLLARFRYKLKSSDFLETLGSHDVDELFDPAKRSTVSVGFGFKPLKSKSLSLDYVAGGALERLDTRTGDTDTSFKFNINENFQWKFGKHLTLKQSLRFYIDPTDDMSYNFRFDSGLQTLLVGAFNLGVSYRMDYDSSIVQRANRQKTKFITSIGVKF